MSRLPEFDGHAIPDVLLLADFFAEHAPDEIEADPIEWPCWADEVRVGIGPAYTPDESIPGPPPAPEPDFEPSEEDRRDFAAWCWEADRRDQDLDDAARIADFQDWLESQTRFTDADLAATGQCPG